MPSAYAHLRFGRDGLPRLPEEVQLLARNYRQLFEVGLQGPDLFFYYSFLTHTRVGELGHGFHMQSGREFFSNALLKLRDAPSDEARAYLYGVLGHYALDSSCHPYITATAEEGQIGHSEMETEFDRLLMSRDGIRQPHLYAFHDCFRLSKAQCGIVSMYYAPASAADIRRCSRNMEWVNRLTTCRRRKMVKILLGFGGKVGREFYMEDGPSEKYTQTNQRLSELYRQAQERYPRLAEQLARGELGKEFEPCFG